jgi:hypothetical protein
MRNKPNLYFLTASDRPKLLSWLDLPEDQGIQHFMNDFCRRTIRVLNPKGTHYLMAFRGQLELKDGKYFKKNATQNSKDLFFQSYFVFSDETAGIQKPTSLDITYIILYEIPTITSDIDQLTFLKARFIVATQHQHGQESTKEENEQLLESCVNFTANYAELDPCDALSRTIFHKGPQNLLAPLSELCMAGNDIIAQLSYASYIVLSNHALTVVVKSYAMINSTSLTYFYYDNQSWKIIDPSQDPSSILSEMMAMPKPDLKHLCELDPHYKKALLSKLHFLPVPLIELKLQITEKDDLAGSYLEKWTHPALKANLAYKPIHTKIHEHSIKSVEWHQSPFTWMIAAAIIALFPYTMLAMLSIIYLAMEYNRQQTSPAILHSPIPSELLTPSANAAIATRPESNLEPRASHRIFPQL